MASERPILIAGAGPVGVITALALARQGFEVQVFEAEQRVVVELVREPRRFLEERHGVKLPR